MPTTTHPAAATVAAALAGVPREFSAGGE